MTEKDKGCREAFEAWAKDSCIRTDLGAWEAWQAAWNRRSQPEWLPIETAPKDGKPILVCNDTTMAAVYWWPCVWMGTTHNGMQKPTHWMPLPAAPQQPIAGNDGREG